MKIVFLAGSRKFSEEIEKIEKELKKAGIVVLKGRDPIDTNEKEAHLKMFERINASDIVYVVAKGGYIGLTVALEIGYAFANKKEIVSSEPLAEIGARSLVSKTMNKTQFVEYILKINV